MNLFYDPSPRSRLFQEPRCQTMMWIGIGGLALSVGGTAMAATQKGPQQPNLANSSAQLSNAEAEMLPIQRQLEAAAQLGRSVSINLPQHSENQQFIRVPSNSSFLKNAATGGTMGGGAEGGAATGALYGSVVPGIGTAIGAGIGAVAGGLFGHKGPSYQEIPYNPADWQKGGKYAGQQLPGEVFTKQVNVPAGPHTFDFTGLGAADIQSKLAAATAKSQLALSQKYDPQFIASAKAQEAEADPQGVAARSRMSDLIQQQINQPQDQPIADEMNRQLEAKLTAGKGLDQFDTGILNQSVADSLGARGGGTGAGTDFTSPLTTGLPGDQRQLQGIGEAQSFLGSGTTPEDVAYRREQQNLANLSAEINGQTPTSEFSSLSAARNGPTPMVGGSALPMMAGNTTGPAGAAAAGAYGTQVGIAANQANPWMLGVSSAINAATTAGNMGYRPFGGN